MPAGLDPARLRLDLALDGLNVAGVADGRAWDHVLPGCRSVLVFGSGGPRLFETFHAWLRAAPERLQEHRHPLDDFVAARIGLADPDAPRHPTQRRWAFCSAEGPPIDFRRLAVDAGLGWISRTGLLLHPEHGLWLGLRAALFTTADLPRTGLPPGPGPCATCSAPCVPACPGGAMSGAPTTAQPSAWDWRTCASFRDGRPCHARCDVRNACPEGTRSRYPDLAQHYHNDPAGSGRTVLARTLGAAPGVGVDPGWKE